MDMAFLPCEQKKNAEIRFAGGEFSLGSILVARTVRGICAILFGDNPEKLINDLQGMFPKERLIDDGNAFNTTLTTVIAFIEQSKTDLKLPLDIQGTTFQKHVWRMVMHIPVGKTASYTDIAKGIGAPASVRAVARSCTKNKIAVAIPCHRIVRKNGDISDYRWGIERKKALLNKEAKKNKDHFFADLSIS